MNAPQRTDPKPSAHAVALAYHEGDMAPRVVARGNGSFMRSTVRLNQHVGYLPA